MMKRSLAMAAGTFVLVVCGLVGSVGAGTAQAGGVFFFVDAQHGWESTIDQTYDLATAKATAWHTSDGGASWKRQATRACAYNGGGAWGGFFAFATRSTGIWVRAGHTVLRTTNGGTTWRSVGWVAQSWLNDASFATSRVGWACSQVGSAAEGGSIAKTTDGGRTWRVQKRIGGHDGIGAFRQVSCPTARDCYVLGAGSRLGGLWATADGGKHWARRPLPNDGFWSEVAFPTAMTGWAVGGGGSMVTTADGGRTWRSVTSGTVEDLRGISFCDAGVGYAVGSAGTVLRTSDAGASWVTLTAPFLAGFDYYAVTCVDATHVWISDVYGNVFATSDGGQTWDANSVYLPSGDE